MLKPLIEKLADLSHFARFSPFYSKNLKPLQPGLLNLTNTNTTSNTRLGIDQISEIKERKLHIVGKREMRKVGLLELIGPFNQSTQSGRALASAEALQGKAAGQAQGQRLDLLVTRG